MKLANVLRGKRAEKKIEVPNYTFSDGTQFAVLAIPLTGLETIDANSKALEIAKSKGVENPKLGDTIFDLALMAAILYHGCVDPDSSEKDRQKSFSSPEEILDAMNPEEIVYLHERHESWQDECSPTSRKLKDDDLLDAVREVAGPDGETTFMRFSAFTRVNFAISMARTLLPSLEAKSTLGSSSESELLKSENDSPL